MGDSRHALPCGPARIGMSARSNLSAGGTMRAAVHTKTPGIRRILAGLGVLVVFGALFVLPLCAALALCTMPCCHHENAASGSVTSGAACETECGIRSAGAAPATIAATAPDNGLPKTSPLAVAAAH